MDIGLKLSTVAELHRLAEVTVNRSHIRGLAYGVVREGQLIYEEGVGEATDGGPAPNSDTFFRIASMTKSFTAAAVLKARDEGLLNLEAPIDLLVPETKEWVLPTRDSPKITLRHLLSMSSGLAKDDQWVGRHINISALEFTSLLRRGCRFAVSPGEKYEYSNLAFGIVGLAFERAVGLRPQDYITHQFLRSLKMKSTVWQLADIPSERVTALGYYSADGNWIPELASPGDGYLGPSVGLWTTVADLSRWVSFWCEAWPARNEVGLILGLASRREAQRVHTDNPAPISGTPGRTSLGYGLGLRITSDGRFGRVVDHSGGMPGYGSNMCWLPERSIGVIALANERFAYMHTFAHDMLGILWNAGEVPSMPPQVPSAPLLASFHALIQLLNGWDDNQATRILDDNVFLDETPARLRRAAEDIVSDSGHLRIVSVDPTNATSGRAMIATSSGRFLQLHVRMAPTGERLIQRYTVTEASEEVEL
jgi:CubicO group peptidase (beta-lactamase class C family)